MSRLGPDGSFLDEGPASHVPGASYVPRRAATDLSAAPLWMAFRDHYTRARERRQPPENAPFECELAPCP